MTTVGQDAYVYGELLGTERWLSSMVTDMVSHTECRSVKEISPLSFFLYVLIFHYKTLSFLCSLKVPIEKTFWKYKWMKHFVIEEIMDKISLACYLTFI